MIWGVGVGRCGTKSLADQMGGLHEPDDRFKHEAIDYHERGRVSLSLINELARRTAMDTPIVVDNKQSLVIRLISEIDEDASFIWLLRSPIESSVSIAKRGYWGQLPRCTPKVEGFFDLTHFRKCAMYWLYKNKLIERELEGLPYQVIFTNSLRVKANKSIGSKAVYHEEDMLWIGENIIPQWEKWKECYDTSLSPA